TVCDVGGATGQLSIILAERHPHLSCVSFDLPVVEPIAQRSIEAAGVAERVSTTSGDFFADPLPPADVITMGMILHDWNLERKQLLIQSAYDALPAGGVLIAVENIIDDDRRENVFGLMMSLNMLIEFGDAFDFTGNDYRTWCEDAGFTKVEILPLVGAASAAVTGPDVGWLAANIEIGAPRTPYRFFYIWVRADDRWQIFVSHDAVSRNPWPRLLRPHSLGQRVTTTEVDLAGHRSGDLRGP